MLYQTLVAAVVLSYILCVMLLSGVQKDDLDSNTLRNLQRHNVNVDDLDNAKKRQSCAAANLQNVKPFESTIETPTKTLKIPSTNTVTEPQTTKKSTTTITTEKTTLINATIMDKSPKPVELSKMESISKFWDIISTNLWKITPKTSKDSPTTKQTTTFSDMFSTKPKADDVSFDEIISGKEIPNFDGNFFPSVPISRTKSNDKAHLEIKPINENYGFEDKLDKMEDFQHDTTTPRIVYLARRNELKVTDNNNTKEEKEIKGKREPDILEIANQVRQLLLKDLKKEIIKDVLVVTTTIATTTETLPTKPNDQSFNVLEAKMVMDRLLHICRSLKLDTTIVEPNLTPNKFQTEFIKPETNPMVLNSIYGRGNTAMSLPIVQSPKNAFYPVNTQPQIHQTFVKNRIQNRIVPKTIQTNSGQIPPLPIPINVKGKIGNYVKLVENQNIVITPKTTIQKNEMIRKNKNEKLSKQRIKKIIQNPIKDKSNYPKPKKYDWIKFREPIDQVNFFETSTVTHRPKKKKIQRKPDQDMNEDTNFEKTIMRSLEMINQPNIQNRYQIEPNMESVRNIDENYKNIETLKHFTEDLKEESDESPIIQRPLTPISKKVTNYDDTHFNKFLKTQKNVNDMLEMILASKSKRLLSIETI